MIATSGPADAFWFKVSDFEEGDWFVANNMGHTYFASPTAGEVHLNGLDNAIALDTVYQLTCEKKFDNTYDDCGEGIYVASVNATVTDVGVGQQIKDLGGIISWIQQYREQ